MNYRLSKEFALSLDAQDKLRGYRDYFHIPLQKNGEQYIYFCGNSLGLQPKKTKEFISQELKDWADLGVEGHVNAKNPWLPYHEFLSQGFARIVGAKQSEVVAMNTLTVNLHLMMVSFLDQHIRDIKLLLSQMRFPRIYTL